MRRFLLLITVALALALLIRGRAGSSPFFTPESVIQAGTVVAQTQEMVAATAVLEESEEQGSTSGSDADWVPTYFPKAKVLSRVSDPVDSEGRQRVIETVETSMKEPYVRVEHTIQSDEQGTQEVSEEVAMVANQLLLQKPDGLAKLAFLDALRKAGAVEVKEIGDAFLATFAAQPMDPRALDTFITRVHEVAGADLTVEPNYIRKLF